MLGKLAQYTEKKTQLDPYLTPHIEVGSEWIKDPTEKDKTIRLIEETIDLRTLKMGKNFFNKTLKA